MYFFFFFPVGTDARPGSPPVGTALLLLLIVGSFSLSIMDPGLYRDLVLSSFRASRPQVAGALLSLFLHGSWLHLFGNALYLWIFGRQIEARLGFSSLVLTFLAGGVAACWFQAWLTPAGSRGYDSPLIGASGSVAALLGVTVVRFHHRKVKILWFLFALLGGMTKAGITYLNTLLACLGWFVLQIVQGLVAWGNGGGAVAYGAHGGGFVFGVAASLLFGLHRAPRREIHLERGRTYFLRNDWYAACGELTTHLELAPEDREARRMRARCRLLLGATGEASSEYQRLFHEARTRGDVPRAASLYREMRTYGIGSGLTERLLLRLAFDFQKARRMREAADVYQEIITRFPGGDVTDLAAVRRAEILWTELGAYEQAQACYRELLDSGRPSEWRDLAEARLRSMRALAGGDLRASTFPRGTSTSREWPSALPGSPSGPRSSRSSRRT